MYMSKKTELYKVYEVEEELQLMVNLKDMEFEDRIFLFDRLYQEYMINLAEENPSKTLLRKYKKVLNEIAKNYFH